MDWLKIKFSKWPIDGRVSVWKRKKSPTNNLFSFIDHNHQSSDRPNMMMTNRNNRVNPNDINEISTYSPSTSSSSNSNQNQTNKTNSRKNNVSSTRNNQQQKDNLILSYLSDKVKIRKWKKKAAYCIMILILITILILTAFLIFYIVMYLNKDKKDGSTTSITTNNTLTTNSINTSTSTTTTSTTTTSTSTTTTSTSTTTTTTSTTTTSTTTSTTTISTIPNCLNYGTFNAITNKCECLFVITMGNYCEIISKYQKFYLIY